MRILLTLCFVLIGLTVAFAQLAIETAPGIIQYGGGTTSIEVSPGYHRFYGEVEGSVTEIAPGVSYYNLRPSLDAELDAHVQADLRSRERMADRWEQSRREAWEREMRFKYSTYGR